MILFFSLLSLCFSITSNENKGNQNTFNINHNQNFQSKKSLATCYEGPFSGYTVGQACYIFTGDSDVTSTNFIFTGNDEHYIEFQGKATITGSSVSTDNQITSSLIRFSSDVEINDFTVKNVVASSNSFGLLNFDSPTVSITDLKFTGTTKVTLFQGSVSQEFEFKDSTIKGLNGNDASDIFGLIHTNLLSTTKSDLVFTFTNINFIENKSPVFLTDSRLTINVLIDSCTFEKNQASTGCCAYMRTVTSTKSNYKITFKDNTFNENQNSARTSIIGGALYITTQETVFEGLNSFSGNEAQFEGDASSEEGAYGSSIYLTQNTLEKYTLIGLIFENDHSSHNGGSIFIYGKDDKSGSNKYPVVIQDCVFTNCYADNNGGAICSGMATTSGIGKGNNDVEIDNCTFTKCRAAFGGALYFEVGSEEGDEETKISNCVFDSNIGGYGSSIYCKSYGFILTESKITNSEKYGSRRDESFLYVYMAFSDRTPYIQDCNFTNNFQTITFISKDPVATSDSSIVSFTNCIFENNDLTLDSIGLLDLSIVSSRTLKITSCTFNKNKGACIKAANSICTAIVSKCIFNGNQGTQGCAIYIDISISSSDKLTIDNCLFTDNIVSVKDTGRASGIVHASTKSVKFTGVNTFIGNSAIYDGSALENPTNDNCAYGGSVFLEHSSTDIFVLSNLIIKDSYSTHYGGGIGLFNEDSKSDIPVYVSIENCTFENCSAGVHGGAFTSGVMNAGIGEKDNDVQFKFCNFYGCNAKEGAGIYVQDGTEDGDEETILYNCLFDACTGSIGTCIYCRSYKFEMHNTIIQNCNVSTHGVSESCIYVKLNEAGMKPFIENCTFTRNEQHVEFYSLLDDDSALDNSIEFKKCKFNLNNALTNGADSILDLQYIYSGEVYFDDCRFEENGGQALKQETDSVCNTYIRNCVFYNNKGGSGCAIYVATTKDDIFVTIENCLFSSNIATSTYGPRGSVFVSTKSIIFKGINTFNSNENIYDTMVPEEIPSGSEASHGGSLSILQEVDSEFILRDLVFMSSKSSHYGGALSVFCPDKERDENGLFFNIENCTFSSCTAGIYGGAISIGLLQHNGKHLFDNDIKISNCLFTKCNATNGGALFFPDGDEIGDEETIIYNCTFDACEGTNGSSIYVRSYKFEMHHSIIKNSIKVGTQHQSCIYGNLNEANVNPVINNCSFFNNDQNIEFHSKNISGSAANSVVFSNCFFHQNNQVTNGADSILELKYIQSDLVKFDSCIFDNNYGCTIRLESGSFCSTSLFNCTFCNNYGQNGCSLYLMSTSSAQTLFVIEDCTFKNNTVVSSWGPRGTIYMSTIDVDFKGINYFIDNKCIYETYDDPGDPGSGIGSYGGSIFIIQGDEKEHTISNLVFQNSYSTQYGGAIGMFAEDTESGPTELFFHFINITFDNCTSGLRGGALTCGTFSRVSSESDNDIKMTNCTFLKCHSLSGGALYFQDGTEEGDEETYLYNCLFDGCTGTNGSSIYCRSYKFEMHDSIIQNSIPYSSSSSSKGTFLYCNLNEANVQPLLRNCTFYNNEQNFEFSCILDDGAINHNSISFEGCNFLQNNKDSNGADTVFDLSKILTETLTFTNCLFESNGGRCLSQDSSNYCNTLIQNCIFSKNHGGDGCGLYFRQNSIEGIHYTIHNSTFIDNICQSSNNPRGVIFAHTASTKFTGINYFINNQVIYEEYEGQPTPGRNEGAYGGSLFLYQDSVEEYTLSNLVFINSYSTHYGGALGILCMDNSSTAIEIPNFINLENCTFINCSSKVQGGAFTTSTVNFGGRTQNDNDVKLSFCTFINCSSSEGGGVYFQDGTEEGDEETYIHHCTFDGCGGTTGTSIHCRSYKFEMYDTIIKNSVHTSSPTHQSCLYIKLNEGNIKPIIQNCTFLNNEQNIDFYSQLDDGTSSTNSISFIKCLFSKNNQVSNGADSILELQYIQSGEVHFEQCTFDQNGGQCLKQESGTTCATFVKDCIFTGNHGASGSAIYVVTSQGTNALMTIENNIFRNNIVASSYGPRGVVHITTVSAIIKGVNQFINNQAIYETYDPESIPSGMEGAYGGSLFIIQEDEEEYTLQNQVFQDSYSSNFAGAFGFFCIDTNVGAYQLFVHIINCTFTNCSSGTHGGALTCGVLDWRGQTSGDNDVSLTNCKFVNCKSPEGGALYFQDGTYEGDEETYIYNCLFDGCSGASGSAIYCRSYKFAMYNSTIQNSPHSSSPSHQSFLYVKLNEAMVKPVIDNCSFINNEQNIEFYSHLDVGTSTSNSISFLSCLFSKNNQQSNGADSILELQYIQSNTVLFDSCIFDQNGGQCLRQESGTFCNTNLKNCTFSNNHGGGGCAIYVIAFGSRKSSLLADTTAIMTIEECTFSDNTVSSSWGPRGAVYITTVAAVFKGVNYFINNKAIYDTYDTETVPGPSQGSNGGSLFIIQETEIEYTISNIVFTNSYSSNYGGAIGIYCLDDEASMAKLFIHIKNCTFNNCSSTFGGSISCLIEGSVDVVDSIFINGSAQNGGEIYCSDDTTNTPSSLTVRYSRFTLSNAISSGGAIYCNSGSVIIQANNFSQTGAKARGSCAYIEVEGEARIGYNNIHLEKESNITSIHFKSTNPSSKLVIAGGCYSSTRTDGDSSADFITYESTGSLEFIGKPCFQRSKEESINLIGSNIELSDEYFNCNECTDLIPPDPTPTAIVTVTSDSSESGGDGGDGSQSGGSKKLSGGAISGIVIACLVLVAAIIILIIFFLRRKTTDNEDARSEAISQEADDDTFSFTNQSGAPYTDNKPIWGGGTSDIGEASQVDDPFMKDFEEQEL
ncbi:hypothetical protein TRFO_30954 [Tritrichomonas foetus]|uniref:Right handed beta helix domain-containing protein n=1 Tax=Tritrichomonas foetus TaxID=1144522 RepID=A0A1J4JWX6_9EUKA|nr:hypothetical protein TRFO_30954 [Tritrichomonas foetus]|eukprot:OHT02038.1 hypothetical protein TRFO_30954 [Tritrichomonas foetus]